MAVPVAVILLVGSFEGATTFSVPRGPIRSPSSSSVFGRSPRKQSVESDSAITDKNEARGKTSLGGLNPIGNVGELTDSEISSLVLDWDKDESLYDAETVVQAVIETALDDTSSSQPPPLSGTEATQTKSGEEMRVTKFDARTADKEKATTPRPQFTTAREKNAPTRASAAPFEAPSVGQILRFATPAIGIWLCGPLLSMIDTGSVGLLSGTCQQAALSPAVAVIDYSAVLAAFTYTASTNLVASSREADRDSSCSEASGSLTQRALVASLQLSTFVGMGLGATLFLFARPILRILIGNDTIEPAVFAAALRYVRIRSLGAPAAVIIGSAQSASLGMQDVRSPLYVLLAAAVVNFMGDMAFVANSNPWIGGAAGAAWATIISQYVAVFLFLRWLTSKPSVANDNAVKSKERTEANENRRQESLSSSLPPPSGQPVNLTDAILELMGGTDEEKGKSRREKFSKTLRSSKLTASVKSSVGGRTLLKKLKALRSLLSSSRPRVSRTKPRFSTRGFLSDHFKRTDLVRFPSLEMVKKFLPYVIPVTTSSFGRLAAYVAMNHVVSSTLGTSSMAAQQIVLSVFFCLTPVADALNQTAQSFVPRLYQQKPSWGRAMALRKALFNFWKAGSLFGVATASAVACIPLISALFTKDAIVVSGANSAAPFLAGVFAVHGVFCATEGMLLGQRDLGFLGCIYALFFVGAPLFMLRVKQEASPDLRSVWKVFLSYQMVRLFSFVGRLWMVQRRTERDCALKAEVN